MNKELFASMREQMHPSDEARAALEQKLVNAKRVIRWKRYAAIAACAAVIAAAVPMYNFIRDSLEISSDPGPVWGDWLLQESTGDRRVEAKNPHSYVLMDDAACYPENSVAVDTGGTGDEDQDMTPGEVADNMLEAGFSRRDIDAYLESGWQMTWAKWWKFYHISEESGEWTLNAILDFSQAEGLAVNTGEAPEELPGGALVGDAPDQSGAIMAYQNLMAQFEAMYGRDCYPQWYGGAYIDERAGLVVNIADGYEPDDKDLFLQIWEWAGTDRVAFGSSRESLNYLRFLQDQAFNAMCELGLNPGCGVNEETGQVELTLPEVTEEALWKLAELDPADSAILVIAGQFSAVDLDRKPAPSVSHNTVQPGGADTPGTVENAIPFDD